MVAYAVFMRVGTRDAEALATYPEMAKKTLEGRNVTVRGRSIPPEVLEGPPVYAAAILEFQTIEEARQWYQSPEYQAAAKIRLQAGDYRAILVEG